MIPIHELRKGSLISFDDYSMEAFEVDYIQQNTIWAKGGKNGQWINGVDLVTGIPITPETLEATGHDGIDGSDYSLDSGPHMIVFDDDGEPVIKYCDHSFRHIKFIHQLQNFYLGITGQEMPLGEFAREKLSKILSI